MRCASVLLAVLLTACGQQPAENLADALAADHVRLKALRAQCAADRQAPDDPTPGAPMRTHFCGLVDEALALERSDQRQQLCEEIAASATTGAAGRDKTADKPK